MATEINCSCEITENEVTICYPPISSGGGGGIGGGGTLNRYAKFTPDGANIGDALIYEDGAGVWGDIGFSGGVGTQLSLGYSASGILTIDGTNYGALGIGPDTVTLQTVTGGINVISRFQINNNDILVKSPNIFDGTYAYFEDDGNGNFTMRSAAPPSGGISSLNALTGATQTFEDDTNVTIVSTGTTHTLTWAGTLADARIASASTWNAKESALTFSTGLTRATNTITNNLSTGVSGGQTLIGGTAAGDKLVIEVTSNATHTAARDLITLRKNSAAAASTSILMTIGDGQGIQNDELSIYTGNNSGTNGYLLRAGTTFAYFNASISLRLQIAAADIIQLSSSTATMVQGITISDAKNIVLNTTTGTKIGTATSQKLAFWNKTPIVQPTTGITAATFVANTSLIANDTATYGGYTMGQIAAALINTGILA